MKNVLVLRLVSILAVAGLAVAVLAPSLVAATIPLLLVAACPVSMFVMMRSMSGHERKQAPDASPERTSDLRRELSDLAERHKRLEAELALQEHASPSLAVRTTGVSPIRDG